MAELFTQEQARAWLRKNNLNMKVCRHNDISKMLLFRYPFFLFNQSMISNKFKTSSLELFFEKSIYYDTIARLLS